MNKLLQSLIVAMLAAMTVPAFAADAASADPFAPQAEAKPSNSGPVVIVNGVSISPVYAEVVRRDLSNSGRQPTDENIRTVLIDNQLLSEEAIKQGLDKPAEIQALLDLQRKDTLGKLVIENYAKTHTISDERIKAEYDKLKAGMGDTEYHTRHILVGDEKLANDIIKQLTTKKAKFEDLAKKYSKDTGSAARGGDLGWMAPNNLVPEFSDTMMKLKKGEITPTPVKTQFGWHVIQMLDSRKLDFPAYEQLKERIANKLMQEDIHNYLVELRGKANIVVPGGK